MSHQLKREGREPQGSSLSTKTAPQAVYIHIPFCTNKCFYCDFNSYVLKDQPVMDYLRALDLEMELTVQETPPGEIKSIFVGGGTPTVLKPDEMEFFLSSVRRHFPNWAADIEFSMEANPGTTDREKLAVMKAGASIASASACRRSRTSCSAESGESITPTTYFAAWRMRERPGWTICRSI